MRQRERRKSTIGQAGAFLASLGLLVSFACGTQPGDTSDPGAPSPADTAESPTPSPTPETTPSPDCSREAIAEDMRATLARIPADADFSFHLETVQGRTFTFSRGDSTMATTYASASTSKWVTAVVILRQVDRGRLSLGSRPQDGIKGWSVDPADPLHDMTLAHLLSFTSGLTDPPPCLNLRQANFAACVLRIGARNRNSGKVPGTEFYYASTHLQVAGLMAIRAAGLHDWQELFDGFREETGLFPSGRYDLPSATNPRLAGGMHWRGTEYVDFLRALVGGELLSEPLRDQMFADQVASATIGYSPALEATGEDWHYGFGNWLECPSAHFDCDEPSYHSSPGAYGAYPFVNVTDGFFGIVARQGSLGTYAEGKAVLDSVRDEAEAWATCSWD